MISSAPAWIDIAAVEPLIFLPDGVYGASKRDAAGPTLVSALGVRHALRCLVSTRNWQRHWLRVYGERFAAAVGNEARTHDHAQDQLAYFLAVLVPRFTERDWGRNDTPLPASDPTPAVRDTASFVPVPQPPCPSLMLLSRVWPLSDEHESTGLHIILNGVKLAPSAGYVSLADLQRQWETRFAEHVQIAARSLAAREPSPPHAALEQAREELRRTAAVQRGPLLFFACDPPRIGHLMPPHHNRSLGRSVSGDAAITARCAAGLTELAVFVRGSRGVWMETVLPRGICIGSGLPARQPGLDGDLAVMAWLRWAATRIATNGRCHEHDGNDYD